MGILRHWIISKREFELLSKRAVCSYDTDELLKVFYKYISSGHYPADVNDKSFF